MSKHPRFYQSLKTALSKINSQSSESSNLLSFSLEAQKTLIGVVETEESTKEDLEEDPQWEVDKLFQTMRDAIVITDSQGRYLRANAAAIILFGATSEELLGKNLENFLAPEVDFSLEWQAQDRISGETKLHRLDGTEVFVDYSATKNFLPGFDLYMFREITKHKNPWYVSVENIPMMTAKMLSESQDRFYSLMENLPCAVYSYDCQPPESMLFISNYIQKISGYPASDFIQNRQRTFMSIIHPEDQSGAAIRLIGKNVTYNNEYRIITADAQIKWVQEQGNGVFDEAGNLFALEGVIYDITERREMEIALGSSLDRFSLIVQSAFDGIWDLILPAQAFSNLAMDLDINLKFGTASPLENRSYLQLPVYYSPRLSQALGYPKHEFPNILDSWLSRVHPEDIKQLLQAIQGYLYYKKSFQNVEYRLRTYQGEYRWYQAAAQAIWNEDGQPMRIVGSMRDITERKQIEREFQLQHHRDQLMVTIAQQIRQSLDLEEILEATAIEIKQFLEAEWVAIYQLSTACPGKCGAAIAANPAYFPCQECMAICLAPRPPVGISPLKNRSSEIPPLATVQSLLVESNLDLVIPISILNSQKIYQSQLVGDLEQASRPPEGHTQFWGLICCHYSQKLDMVEPWRVEFLQRLALQLAIAIQQSQLYARIKQANHELARLAAIDGLTQVWNRRYFDECLDREWWRCRREQQYLSLILCDVDYFKDYNDTYGHPAGDQVLFQISQTMSQAIKRSTDLVARYGGEEFAIILPDTDSPGAETVAHRIRTAIYDLQIPHRSSPLGYITISLGVATVLPNGDRYLTDLMKTTDQALYTAKAQGRNRAFIVG